MAQTRITNYGDDFTHKLFSTWASTVLPQGRYSGFEFVLKNTDRFALSAGSVLLPNGVLVLEDAEVVLPPIVPLPAAATVYEVRISQVDESIIGGNPAEYALVVSGTPLDTADGRVTVVLGYLSYPGSPVSLAASQYTPSPPQRSDAAVAGSYTHEPYVSYPPYAGTIDIPTANITSLNTFMGSKHAKQLTGSAIIPAIVGETYVVSFQVPCRGVRPSRISIDAQFPTNDTLQFELRDTNGVFVTLTTPSFVGNTFLTEYATNVPRDGTDFSDGKAFTLYVGCTLQAGTVFNLQGLTVQFAPTVLP